MKLLRRFRPGTPDPEAFLAELSRSHSGNYRPMDRYTDFRGLFMDSERGKRVLFEILSWGGMFRTSARGSFDTNETFFHEGERNVALKLMTTMNAEPTAKPTSTKGK